MEKSLRVKRRLRLPLLGRRKHQDSLQASPTSPTDAFHHSEASLTLARWWRILEVVLLGLVILGVAFGVEAPLFGPVPRSPVQGLFVIASLTIGTALLIPILRQRFGLTAQAQRTLPDPLYSLYLATFILVSSRSAVALAILTPFAAEIPSALHFAYRLLFQRRYRTHVANERGWRATLVRARALLRQSAVGTLITFLAEIIYVGATPIFQRFGRLSLLHAHLPAALLSAVAVLLCLSALRLTRQMYDARHGAFSTRLGAPSSAKATTKKPTLANVIDEIRSNARRYLASPMFRYQALLLSICPLLPLVEVVDDVEAEFAWALFLAPLCAVYYLALLSLSLQQRTGQLQQTIKALGASWQRQAELQGYAALITQAQEDERRRLARELHDDTAQALVALARGLDTLRVGQTPRHRHSAASSAPETQEASDEPHELQREQQEEDARFIAELGAMARRALESVRRACRDLRPSVLDDLGLAAALEALCASMSQRGLPTEYVQTGDERSYPPTIEVAVYRIAQESLMNAYRHGQPTQARLMVNYQPDRLRLEINDNGHGFNPQALIHPTHPGGRASGGKGSGASGALLDPDRATHDLSPQTTTRSGLGMLGMRERAALIGATLTIQSARGQGVCVTLDVPLPQD